MPTNNDDKVAERKRSFLPVAREAQDIAETQSERKVWDGPSKQFIRHYAWLNVIKAYLLKRKNEGEDTTFKYLTLPGKNATDIGFFWKNKLIVKNNNQQLNVAIIDREEAENVTINLNNSIGRPLAVSSKDFHLALKDDKLIKDQFPFDVINLDFCNFISSKQPDSIRTSKQNQETISKIFDLQKGQSFLLLLTYRAIDDDESTADLLQIIDNNIKLEPSFREKYKEEYGSTNAKASLANIKRFNQLAYSKLIAKYARDHQYRTIEHFCGEYSRINPKDGTPYFMICHSFELEQITKANPKSKYHPRYTSTPSDEGEEKIADNIPIYARKDALSEYENCITSLVNRKTTDVDTVLKKNSPLKGSLSKESDSLLEWWKNI